MLYSHCNPLSNYFGGKIMEKITVDFAKSNGIVKPMHSVNNGPAYKFATDQRITNLHHFQAAGIPYARNHDASFYATYGGEHIVDVNNIFRNFDADPEDPASYDFDLTDEYLKVCELGGCEPYYRLGSKIEHWKKKYNTLPPADFKKWAVICEHIIRHYCYGWADGFHMKITYWEIWNEPDLDPDDSTHKRCWGGTAKEFYQLFRITLDHLKTCFPELKIGGPAVANPYGIEWIEGLFNSLGEIKPDFFSWHIYAYDVTKIQDRIREMRLLLDKHGLTECESILNEWNYVKGWEDETWIYSLKMEKSLKGAAFIAATMLMSQCEELDNLMYYDARPSAMNGLFKTDCVAERLKGYYPFYMFNQLYTQKKTVSVSNGCEGSDIWTGAAKGDEQNTMICYYNDNDASPDKDIKVEFKNVENKNGVRLEYYLLDEEHDCELVREEIFTSSEFASYIKLKNFSTYLLKIITI